jgi:hypothetical protein
MVGWMKSLRQGLFILSPPSHPIRKKYRGYLSSFNLTPPPLLILQERGKPFKKRPEDRLF